jgi:hypothetical protein
LIDLQTWAEGLLDDQKPLEVLYVKHPETDEDVIIIKVDDKVTMARADSEQHVYVAMVGVMAQEAWEKYEE